MLKPAVKKPMKTKTIPYDVAEQLRTPEEMAAYLDAWLEEAPDDAAGIARALGEGMTQVAKDPASAARVCIEHSALAGIRALPPCSRWRGRSVSSCTPRRLEQRAFPSAATFIRLREGQRNYAVRQSASNTPAAQR